MASGKLYDSNINALLQNSSLDFWCPNSSSTYNGSKVDYLESVKGKGNADSLSCPLFDKDDNSDEEYDGCFQRPGKKRRLSADQVEFLERNFENENKLHPERKFQLAKELGLQPRQVAIWFQNRRARSKTKQMEKEYDCLRASYDKLKDNYESLLKDNEKMKNEVRSLRDKLLIKDSGEENQEHSCHNANNSTNSESQNQDANGVPDTVASAPPVAWKQEDASSAKSDAFDTDSLHYSDGNISSFLEPAYSSNLFEKENNSTFLEPAYSSNIFESDQSDDADNFSMSLLQTPYCPKLEDGVCDLGFPVEDQLFCFWP